MRFPRYEKGSRRKGKSVKRRARAKAEALAKLLIEKRLITETEFMEMLKAERFVYQAMLEKMG